MQIIIFFILSALVIHDTVADTAPLLQSSKDRVHLVELFSSEGCSSCPPAEAWIASLRANPELWKKFVPIEFHVDYWNRLGWTDRLSKSIFTGRQQAYASEWSNSSVYTPGFVMDGNEWRPYGKTLDLDGFSSEQIGILSVKRTGKNLFSVSFDSVRALQSIQIYGALLGNQLESKVSTGENSGSVLRHEFAVLALTQKSMEGDKKHYTAVVQLSPSTQIMAKSYSLAFWVTLQGSQKPLQAVGGDFNY